MVDRDLRRAVRDIVEGDDRVFQSKSLLDRGFHRTIILSQNIFVTCLGSHVLLIHFRSSFQYSGRAAIHSLGFRLSDFDFRVALQDIVNRVGQRVRDGAVIERNDVIPAEG